MSVLAFPAPSLLHELLGTYIHLTPVRKRRLRKDSQPFTPFRALRLQDESGSGGKGWLLRATC